MAIDWENDMLRTSSIIAAIVAACATVPAGAQSVPQIATSVLTAAPAQWGPGPGWDQDIDVRCQSDGYNYRMCQIDTGRGSSVRLVRQISNTPCMEGRNWGWNRAGVWVDQGCAGVFRVSRRWSGGPSYPPPDNGGWQPGPGWDQSIRVRCQSDGYNYRMCRVDTGRGSNVYISRQISKTPCMEGRNWGWNRAGIWVDQGCAAEFVVDRRWR